MLMIFCCILFGIFALSKLASYFISKETTIKTPIGVILGLFLSFIMFVLTHIFTPDWAFQSATTAEETATLIKLSANKSSNPEVIYEKGGTALSKIFSLSYEIIPGEIREREGLTSPDINILKGENMTLMVNIIHRNPKLSLWIFPLMHWERKTFYLTLPSDLYRKVAEE